MSQKIRVSMASRFPICVYCDAGVVVGCGVLVADGAVVAVGLGVDVIFIVGLGVGLVVLAGVTVSVGTTAAAVGLINITRIAPSSGTGETTFRPEITRPITTTTKTMIPIMMVSAAIVFLRSSIY